MGIDRAETIVDWCIFSGCMWNVGGWQWGGNWWENRLPSKLMKLNTFIVSTRRGNGGRGTGCLVVWSVRRGGAFLWSTWPNSRDADTRNWQTHSARQPHRIWRLGIICSNRQNTRWHIHTLGRCPPGQLCGPERAGHTYTERGEHVDAG